jgi:type IV fimbrial biogenesis protein FimT
MLTPDKIQQGITLVEIVVALSIVVTVMLTGMPNLSAWIQNTQVRTTAESIQNGLQLARSEAARRNTSVHFQFTSSTDNSCALSTTVANWVVSLDDPADACGSAVSDTVAPRIIQTRSNTEGTVRTAIVASQSMISFSGLGRSSGAFTVNISNPTAGTCKNAGGTVRCLRILVSAMGQIRLCDPALSDAHDPQYC